MKAKLLLTSLFALSVQQTVLAQTDANGYTTVNMSMGANYQNRVFFDFSTNNMVSQPANAWDVAFYRASMTNFGTRINDAYDIKVYQASDNPADWNNITTNNVASYGEPLFNPDNTTAIQNGAFEQGSAAYGWGDYNVINHHVEGKVIFIMQYASGASVKFMIEDYYGDILSNMQNGILQLLHGMLHRQRPLLTDQMMPISIIFHLIPMKRLPALNRLKLTGI